MSNMDQVEDNIKTFVDFKPISEDEQKVINNVVAIPSKINLYLSSSTKVP